MITPYMMTTVIPLGSPEELVSSPDDAQTVLARVVAIEGPIERQVAYRRVAQHWGMDAPDRMAERVLIKAASNLVQAQAIYVTGGTFFWPEGRTVASVRGRGEPGVPAAAALIAPEELAAAAALVLAERGALAPDVLRGAVAAMLGVADDAGLERGVNHLVAAGRAKVVAGLVRLL